MRMSGSHIIRIRTDYNTFVPVAGVGIHFRPDKIEIGRQPLSDNDNIIVAWVRYHGHCLHTPFVLVRYFTIYLVGVVPVGYIQRYFYNTRVSE